MTKTTQKETATLGTPVSEPGDAGLKKSIGKLDNHSNPVTTGTNTKKKKQTKQSKPRK
jgi:hypothetical protein